jgi:hypothetical protein
VELQAVFNGYIIQSPYLTIYDVKSSSNMTETSLIEKDLRICQHVNGYESTLASVPRPYCICEVTDTDQVLSLHRGFCYVKILNYHQMDLQINSNTGVLNRSCRKNAIYNFLDENPAISRCQTLLPRLRNAFPRPLKPAGSQDHPLSTLRPRMRRITYEQTSLWGNLRDQSASSLGIMRRTSVHKVPHISHPFLPSPAWISSDRRTSLRSIHLLFLISQGVSLTPCRLNSSTSSQRRNLGASIPLIVRICSRATMRLLLQ